jgi:hypothetical protein
MDESVPEGWSVASRREWGDPNYEGWSRGDWDGESGGCDKNDNLEWKEEINI